MTLPTFVAMGASSSGTGDVTPGLPAGHTSGDLLLLMTETSAEAVTAPSGYTEMPGSPIQNAAATTRLTVFYKYDGGSESAPTVTDPGDHCYAIIGAFRGVSTLVPFHAVAGAPNSTATTNGTWPSMFTAIDDCLVVCALAWAADSAGPLSSSVASSSLASVTVRNDEGTVANNGGGLVIFTGTKASHGNIAVGTCTLSSTSFCSMTIALAPIGAAITVLQPPIGPAFITGSDIVSDVDLADTVYYRFCTVGADGQAIDADSTPTVDIEEDGGTAAAMGATVTDIGVGLYRVTVAATTGNGFEVGKRYSIMVNATVGSRSSSRMIAEFMIRPAPAVAGSYPATVADYETGKAPLQPTTAGRTLSVGTDNTAQADLAKWKGTAPAAVTASGYVQSALLRWLTDDSAGTPAALTATGKYLQTALQRWLTDDAAGTPAALSSNGKAVPADVERWLNNATQPNALVTGDLPANAKQWAGAAVAVPNTAGTPLVDVSAVLGNANVTLRQFFGIVGRAEASLAQTGGSTTTIKLHTGESTTDDIFKSCTIVIDSGTGQYQSRTCTGYVGSTRVATVDRAWDGSVTPDNTTVYTIRASGLGAGGSSITTTQIRDAILTYAYRSGRSVGGLLRRLGAALEAATGLKGSTVTYFQPDGATEEFHVTQNTTSGTRTNAVVTNSETSVP